MLELLQKWSEHEPDRCSCDKNPGFENRYLIKRDPGNVFPVWFDKIDLQIDSILGTALQAIQSKIDEIEKDENLEFDICFRMAYGQDEETYEMGWYAAIFVYQDAPSPRVYDETEFHGDCSQSLAYGVFDSYIKFLEWLQDYKEAKTEEVSA